MTSSLAYNFQAWHAAWTGMSSSRCPNIGGTRNLSTQISTPPLRNLQEHQSKCKVLAPAWWRRPLLRALSLRKQPRIPVFFCLLHTPAVDWVTYLPSRCVVLLQSTQLQNAYHGDVHWEGQLRLASPHLPLGLSQARGLQQAAESQFPVGPPAQSQDLKRAQSLCPLSKPQ